MKQTRDISIRESRAALAAAAPTSAGRAREKTRFARPSPHFAVVRSWCARGGFIAALVAGPLLLHAAQPKQPAGRRNAATSQQAAAADDAASSNVAPDLNQTLLIVIREGAVQRALKLQPRQVQSIDEVLAEVDPPLWALRDEAPAQGAEKAAQLRAAFAGRLAAILKPEQKERLDQIVLQTLSLGALAAPQVGERIGLSADQQERIRRIFAEAQRAAAEAQSTVAKQGVKAGEAAARKSLADGRRKVLAALSDQQRERFIGLLGEPFETSKIRQAAARAPELKEIDGWINSPPLAVEQLRGKVVALHFWAFGCINCVRNLPWYDGWQQAYSPRGLVVLGVHTPETQAERDENRVRAKVKENGMQYPIAIDGQAKTWAAWTNRMWPSVYLIDKRGYVRYWWYGELNWQGAEGEKFMRAKIEELLAEKD